MYHAGNLGWIYEVDRLRQEAPVCCDPRIKPGSEESQEGGLTGEAKTLLGSWAERAQQFYLDMWKGVSEGRLSPPPG